MNSFEPITLSELIQQSLEKDMPCRMNVTVDRHCIERINGIEALGLIAKADGAGFDFDVMEAVIRYRQLRVEVFIQISSDFLLAPAEVMSLASRLDANVLLMPPTSKDDDEWVQWVNLVCEYCKLMLDMPDFSKELLPVTSYVQTMVMKLVGHEPIDQSLSRCIDYFYAANVSGRAMKTLQSRLRGLIHDAHGGSEGFEQFVLTTLGVVHERIEERAHEYAKSVKEWLENVTGEGLEDVLRPAFHGMGCDDDAYIDLIFSMLRIARHRGESQLDALDALICEKASDVIPADIAERYDVRDVDYERFSALLRPLVAAIQSV